VRLKEASPNRISFDNASSFTYPALGVFVQIRTPGGKLERLYMTRSYDRTKRIREFRIAVMDEVSVALEEASFVHGDISYDLHHPGFIGMWRDPGDLNATAL